MQLGEQVFVVVKLSVRRKRYANACLVTWLVLTPDHVVVWTELSECRKEDVIIVKHDDNKDNLSVLQDVNKLT